MAFVVINEAVPISVVRVENVVQIGEQPQHILFPAAHPPVKVNGLGGLASLDIFLDEVDQIPVKGS